MEKILYLTAIFITLFLSQQAFGQKTVFQFGQQANATSGPVYVGQDQIIISYSYSSEEAQKENQQVNFQLININSSQIVQNFTGGEIFDNLIWINGTQTIVGTYLKTLSNGSQFEIMRMWNFTQASPINEYTIPGDCSEVGEGYIYISAVPGSTDHVAIAGGCTNAEIYVLNIWTNDQVFLDKPTNQNSIEGFAINQNRYSYLQENVISEGADIQSCLRIMNPKTKQIEKNIVYNVSSVSYQPMFNSISPFNSNAFGNLLALFLKILFFYFAIVQQLIMPPFLSLILQLEIFLQAFNQIMMIVLTLIAKLFWMRQNSFTFAIQQKHHQRLLQFNYNFQDN